MGEASNKLKAEGNEESAVIVLEKIREMFNIPEEQTVLSFLHEVTPTKDLIISAMRTEKGVATYLSGSEGEVGAALLKLQRRAMNQFNMLEVKAMQDQGRIIKPR